jgi:DNA-binding transcriptional regulator YiaG
MYHYTLCGLDNVWLENGYQVKETSYGQGVSVHDVEGLHETIAYNVIMKSKRLTAQEIKYLRKEISLSQVGLALALGVSENTIRGWENSRTKISSTANRFIRVLYLAKLGKDTEVLKIIDNINQLDEDLNNMTLSEKNNHWVAKVA